MPSGPAKAYGFGDAAFSWATYDEYRPAYPPALFAMIFDYHRTRGNGAFSSALDMGCGSGAASGTLAHYVKNLTVADPAASNVAAARSKFSDESFRAKLPHECNIKYVQVPGEQAAVPVESQDLVTMFEAIHWGDAAAIMTQAAAALKPKGTLALACYTPRPIVLGNPAANVVWNRLWQAHIQGVFEPDASKPVKIPTQLAIRQANLGLDFVPIDPGLWEAGARRVRLNCGNRGELALRLAEYEGVPLAENKVQGNREALEEMEMEGWIREVDVSWFKRYYYDTYQTSNALSEGFVDGVESLWNQLEEAIKNGPSQDNGGARILFPGAVLLATRKARGE